MPLQAVRALITREDDNDPRHEVLHDVSGMIAGEPEIGSPLQVFHDAPGSAAMQALPWAFVPTVLVPIWMVLHGIVFAQLRRLSPSVRAPG